MRHPFSFHHFNFEWRFYLLFFTLQQGIIPHCFAQPGLNNFQTASGNGSNLQATISAPVGLVEGNLLVAGIALEKGNGVALTSPTGWILIRRTNNNSDCGIATYYKIASASEPASYSFGLSTSGNWAAGITRLTNVSVTSPIDTSSGVTGGNNTNPTAPSLTTRGPSRRVLCFYTNKKASTFTPDFMSLEIYDAPNTNGGGPANMMADFIQNNPGPTAVRTAIPVDPEKWAAQQVAITPFNVLPIELVDFKALACNEMKAVCLNWITASETGNDFFTVERSLEGETWTSIATVDGAGHSISPLNYSTRDESAPPGMLYYRLRQTDFDGSTTVFGPVAVQVKPERILAGFPNPASRTIHLTGDLPNGTLLIRLVDVNGKSVLENSIEHAASLEPGPLNIDLPELPAGAYLLTVGSPNDGVHQQLRIQVQ